jgi:hypothetical protein
MAMTTVSVSALPVNAVTSAQTVCASTPATLTAGGANTYTWSTSQTGVTAIVSPSMQTVYTVTGQIGGCMGTATVQVSTNPNPVLTINGSGTVVCAGQPVTMTVSGADSYTWNPATLTGTSVVDSPTATIMYHVTGSNSLGCTSNAGYLVLTDPLPNLFVTQSAATLCSGSQVTLAATGGTAYLWEPGSVNGSPFIDNPLTTTVYTVTGTHTSNTCTATRTLEVQIYEPILQVSPSATVCKGSVITLTAGAGSNYTWSANGGVFSSATYTPMASTVYSVTALTGTGSLYCPASGTIGVDVNDLPEVLGTPDRTTACRNEKVQLTASGAASYSWTGVGITGANATNAVITVSSAIVVINIYTVTGTDANGCVNTYTVKLNISGCTGISEQSGLHASINVYPNPGNGVFTIECGQGMKLELVNALGQYVKSVQAEADATQLDISGLDNGLYFIIGKMGETTIMQKIILNK